MLPLSLPTPTRLDLSRSTWRSVALVPMPSVTVATVRAAVAPVVVVVTVRAARAGEASSARVAEALPPVAVAATSTPRVATRPRLLKHLYKQKYLLTSNEERRANVSGGHFSGP